jgi:hypothetical protein
MNLLHKTEELSRFENELFLLIIETYYLLIIETYLWENEIFTAKIAIYFNSF